MIKIVVGGGRDCEDYRFVKSYLDHVLAGVEDIRILSGHCRGVDMLAERYAKEKGIPIELHPADWKRYGRAAGPRRNREMVEAADWVIAFWNGSSKGTKSLIDYAHKCGKPIKIKQIDV